MTTPTIAKALPFDAAPGGAFPEIMPAPYRIIYDSTVTPTPPAVGIGNLYPSWATVVNVANQFQGPSEIYIRNGSVIPAGSYTMPTTWYLTTDSHGTSFSNGVYFSNSPIALTSECEAPLVFYQSSAGSTFTLSNPQMLISGCLIELGTNGTLINGTSNSSLRLIDAQITSSGQTLMTGSTNTVTALEQTSIQNNLLPATMTIEYDPTSHVNSQNGNTGIALAPGGGSAPDAAVVTYEPGVPSNWSPSPGFVSIALDQLAAKDNLPQLPGTDGYYELEVHNGDGYWVIPPFIGTSGISVSGTPSIGQVLTATSVSAADWQTPSSSSFTAGGDLSGTSSSQEVIGIRNISVPVPSGSDTVLTYNAGSLIWATPAPGTLPFDTTFQPGGTAGLDVYTTQASLSSALSSMISNHRVYFDFSHNSNTYTATGSINIGMGTTLVGVLTDGYEPTFVVPTTPAAGFTTAPIEIRDLQLSCNGSSGNVLFPEPNFLRLTGITSLVCPGGAGGGYIISSSTTSKLFIEDSASIGDGTNPVINIASGGAIEIVVSSTPINGGYAILANAFSVHLPNGSSASITVSFGTATVSGLSDITPDMVGNYIVISNSFESGNNGSWQIATYISPTSVTIINAVASTDTGGDTWIVNTNSIIIYCQNSSQIDPSYFTMNGTTVIVPSLSGSVEVTYSPYSGQNTPPIFNNFGTLANYLYTSGQYTECVIYCNFPQITGGVNIPSATPLQSGSSASINIVSGIVTLTGGSGFTPNMANGVITINGADSAGNNGTFFILSVSSSTEITYTNPNAVTADANNGSIGWDAVGAYALPPTVRFVGGGAFNTDGSIPNLFLGPQGIYGGTAADCVFNPPPTSITFQNFYLVTSLNLYATVITFSPIPPNFYSELNLIDATLGGEILSIENGSETTIRMSGLSGLIQSYPPEVITIDGTSIVEIMIDGMGTSNNFSVDSFTPGLMLAIAPGTLTVASGGTANIYTRIDSLLDSSYFSTSGITVYTQSSSGITTLVNGVSPTITAYITPYSTIVCTYSAANSSTSFGVLITTASQGTPGSFTITSMNLLGVTVAGDQSSVSWHIQESPS